MSLWPVDRIQRRFARVQIRLGAADEVSALEDAPEQVQAEINWNADVVSDEALVIETWSECIEAVEKDDQAEEDSCCVGKVRLEGGLQGELIAIDALCLTRIVKPDVCNVDGHPGEERGNGGEVLEPLKDLIGA